MNKTEVKLSKTENLITILTHIKKQIETIPKTRKGAEVIQQYYIKEKNRIEEELKTRIKEHEEYLQIKQILKK